jgi:hypothetical protein
MKLNKLLKIIFLIDAVITLGFGLFSWISPEATFATLIAIPEPHESLILALLSSMSILYILLGLICLIGFSASFPVSLWIGILMVIRHAWIGSMKVMDIGKDWLIGNPYPDIMIHSFFVVAYLLTIYLVYKSQKR